MQTRIFSLFFILFILILSPIHAEDKTTDLFPPKLSDAETAGGPTLMEGGLYPPWGAPCTNFTYSVIYKDEKGRTPAYMRIWLDGNWHDMKKSGDNYKSGVRYTFSYVPDSGKEIFYFFEASNGEGKARAAFIDSPNQGPILYSEKFDNNQILLFSKDRDAPLWAFDTGSDMVHDVSLSDDGEYLAASTERFVYLFSKNSPVPLWNFCKQCTPPKISMGEHTAAVISADGKYVAAVLKNTLYFFSRENNTPLWSADISCNAVGMAISEHGEYVSAGVSNCGENGNSIFFFGKNGTQLWKYQTKNEGYANSGEVYAPAMTPDGKYVAMSTGCPDRRGYLFSNDGKMLYRSEPLQRDAPVHESAISDDGKYIAYGTDGEQNKPNKFLFAQNGALLWSHAGQDETDARAISISGDGNYVASGTSNGKVYLFSRNSNTPLWTYAVQGNYAKVGDVKLNFEGSLLVAGTTANKVYLFSRGSSAPIREYSTPTWINAIDFNGELIAAGTGFKEYQFEGNSAPRQQVVCRQINQPPAMETDGGEGGTMNGDAICGNKICEPNAGESAESCTPDCAPGGMKDDEPINDMENRTPDDNETPNDYMRKGTRTTVCKDGKCVAVFIPDGQETENLTQDIERVENNTAITAPTVPASPDKNKSIEQTKEPEPIKEAEKAKEQPKQAGIMDGFIRWLKEIFGMK